MWQAVVGVVEVSGADGLVASFHNTLVMGLLPVTFVVENLQGALQHRCGYLPFCHTGGDFEKDSQGRLDHLHGKFMLFGKLPDLPERDREISPYGERQTALRLVIGGIRAIGGIGVIEALRGIRALGAL